MEYDVIHASVNSLQVERKSIGNCVGMLPVQTWQSVCIRKQCWSDDDDRFIDAVFSGK